MAYPIYQLLGTFRHEASHALAALAQGSRITRFVFWPTHGYWGYVSWEGPTTAATLAAPYVCDLLTFAVSFLVCMSFRFKRRWLWLNVVIVGMVSPLANSLYNYLGDLRGPNDVGRLFEMLPPALVHTYFWLTMGAYLAGLILVFTTSPTARPAGRPLRGTVPSPEDLSHDETGAP